KERTSTTLAGDAEPRLLQAAFTADGRLLAAGAADGTVRLWDAATGKALATLQGHKDAVHAVAVAGDGVLLAAGGGDGTVKVWEPEPLPVRAVPNQDVGLLQAEKDFKVAEFYRRGGQRASALFYYELVCRRYPDSAVARKAAERLWELQQEAGDYADMEKAADGVQLYIVANADKKGSLILTGPPPLPGGDLQYPKGQTEKEIRDQRPAYAAQFHSRLEGFATGRATLDILLEAQRFWTATFASDEALVRTRSFRIPFQVAHAPRGLKKLVLYVSDD